MSYVNFDKYPFWLSWQVLNKNRGRMADRSCNIFYWHYIHYKTMFFFSILFCIFHIIIIILSRKKRGIGGI